jgi:hypothetical protein
MIDPPEEQVMALDNYRKKERISRAEAVRRAVAAFLPGKPGPQLDGPFQPTLGIVKPLERSAIRPNWSVAE